MKRDILSVLLVMCISILPALSQGKTESSLNRKIEILSKGGQVQLKVIENGKTVIDKSYDSMEELHTDSDLEAYNLKIGTGSGLRKIMFKDDAGNIHKLNDDDSFEWVVDRDTSSETNVFFEFSEAGGVSITKDGSGNMIIKRDGEVIDIDIDAMTDGLHIKVLKQEDGSFLIEDENGSRTIQAEELKMGKAMFFKQGSFEMEGDKSIMFKSKDADGFFSIELLNEGSWVMDSLHEKDHNVMFFSSDDDVEGERHVFIMSESSTSEHGKMIKIIVDRIHLNISDLEDLKVVEEIPGSNVTSSKLLKLEEVNYYPNPNTGIFNLKFSAKGKPTQIRIIDMMGKEVYNENLKEFSGMYDNRIDLTGNDKGVYILQVLQGAKSWNKKIVIE